MADLRLVSREFLKEFINLYKEYPCLWKIKSKEYTDKHKKNAAYDVLVKKMKEIDPNANKDAVVKKINSLRTCFRKELKKFNKSKKSRCGMDDIRKPNLWYFDLFLFLQDQETPRQDGKENLDEEIFSENSEREHYNIIDGGNETTTKEDDVLQPKTEQRPARPLATSFSKTGTKRKSNRKPNTEQASTPALANCFSKRGTKRKQDRFDKILNIVAENLQTQEKYSSFGKHIAEELQELPNVMAIYCKKLISEAICQAQLGNLNRHSRITNECNIHIPITQATANTYEAIHTL